MMLKSKKILFPNIVSIITICIFTSCSTDTAITSWNVNSFNENRFNKILVMVLIKDLEYRVALENEIASELNNSGITSIQSLKILSPVEKYSKDDFDTLLQKNNFDALLIVKYEGSIVENTKRDGIKYYKYYRKFFRPIRRKGYIESHKTVILESRLFSAVKETDVWIATTKTVDSSGAEDLALSVSQTIIKDLKKNKLIK
jgi:hypothetical protein